MEEVVEVLSRLDCLRLLAGHSLGRVAYTERALPSIRPLPYWLLGRHLVLDTRSPDMAARLDGQIVAIGIDDSCEEPDFGWSIVVTGLVSVLQEPGELLGAPRDRRADSDATAVVVAPGDIRGRRVVRYARLAG